MNQPTSFGKTGMILGNLVSTLELQKTKKRDFVVPTSEIKYRNGRLFVGSGGHYPGAAPNDFCDSQIAEKLQIPLLYYRRMKKDLPTLLANNINEWLALDQKSKYLIRTFESDPEQAGIARAFLSDNYSILDNFDVLLAALEAIKKAGVEVEITKAEVTDLRLYLHVVCPSVEYDGTAFLRQYMKDSGETNCGIYSGFVLANSEVGKGAFEIGPRALIGKCSNGLVVKDDKIRRIHLGSKLEAGEVLWSEKTKAKNYELVISQTEDAIKTFLSADYLGKMVRKIADAHEIKLEHPLDTVQNVCRELSVTEDHKKAILDFFLKDGDHNASGVFQAITREAQNMKPDVQFEVESGIGSLLPSIKKFDKAFSKN